MNGDSNATPRDQPAIKEFNHFFEKWWAFATGVGEFLALISALQSGSSNLAWVLGILFVLTMLVSNLRLYKIANTRDKIIIKRNGDIDQLSQDLAKAKSPEFTTTARYIISAVEDKTRESILVAADYAARCVRITDFSSGGLKVRDIDTEPNGEFVIAHLPENAPREFTLSDRFYLQHLTIEGRQATVAELIFNNYSKIDNIGFFAVEITHDGDIIEQLTKSTAVARVKLAEELRIVPVFDVAALSGTDFAQVKKQFQQCSQALKPV